jgi:hypothetical protein
MRVALLLCGQARWFRDGYPSIRAHVLDVYQPDVYIHTWSSPTDTFTAAPWNKLGILRISTEDIAEYIRLYAPKRSRVDPVLSDIPLRPVYARTSAPDTRTNYYSYLISLKRCAELVTEPYDMVIIARSDIHLYAFPRLQEGWIHVWDRLPTRPNVLEAMVCAVPGPRLSLFVSLPDHLEAYYDKGYDMNYEEMTHAHFQEQNLYPMTLRLSHDQFEWGYFRGTRIERMKPATEIVRGPNLRLRAQKHL